MNVRESEATRSIARWNLGLTLLALLVIGSSFVFRPRGGGHNALVDSAQVLVIGGYVLVTPVLCVLAWRARKLHGVSSATTLVVFGIWLVALIGSVFVHF